MWICVLLFVLLFFFFFFSSRRRHTRLVSDWSSDVCSSDLTSITRAHDKDRTRRASRQPRAEHDSERRFTLHDHKQPAAQTPQDALQRADPEPPQHQEPDDAARDALSPARKENRNPT